MQAYQAHQLTPCCSWVRMCVQQHIQHICAACTSNLKLCRHTCTRLLRLAETLAYCLLSGTC